MSDRRENILGAAVRLFQRYGYRKTTVGDIAKEAGIGKGSVYLEFSSKEEVMFALIENHEKRTLAEVQQAATGDGSVMDRLTAVAMVRPLRNFDTMEHIREIFEILVSLRGRQNDRVLPYWQASVQEVAKLIQEGCESGDFTVPDVEHSASTFYSALDVSSVFAMHGLSRETLETTLRDIVQLLINGLRNGGTSRS